MACINFEKALDHHYFHSLLQSCPCPACTAESAHKRYSTSFICSALLGISSRQAIQRASIRSPWTHFDPAAGVDNEWYCPMMRRMPPGKISHRRHISLRVPLWRQVAYEMRPGRLMWMHVRHSIHRLPDKCQGHQACASAGNIHHTCYRAGAQSLGTVPFWVAATTRADAQLPSCDNNATWGNGYNLNVPPQGHFEDARCADLAQ